MKATLLQRGGEVRLSNITREGNTEVDESKLPEVTKWWKDNVDTQDESVYTRNVISRFDTDEKLKLLIVVDKLLTGFDEPKNTVLYIDKPLKSHNLIQAIARVNRLHPLKKFGLLIDYRGILAELDTTIGKYQDLASRICITSCGPYLLVSKTKMILSSYVRYWCLKWKNVTERWSISIRKPVMISSRR
ncbi:putative type I restriction enzyme HsdR protein [Escherichia coli]|nr:putative type I restriction enzyme HsdR protein [Escherichia coli]